MRGTDQAEVVERQPFGQQPAEEPHDGAGWYEYTDSAFTEPGLV